MSQKLEVKIIKLEAKFSAIWDKLVEMDKRLEGMDHVIRGNGTPGLVAKTEAQDERLKTLEGKKKDWKELTAMVIGGGVVAVISAVLQHFVH